MGPQLSEGAGCHTIHRAWGRMAALSGNDTGRSPHARAHCAPPDPANHRKQSDDPFYGSDFRSCDASGVTLWDQDCAQYAQALRNVQVVRVAIGPGTPLGGPAGQQRASSARR